MRVQSKKPYLLILGIVFLLVIGMFSFIINSYYLLYLNKAPKIIAKNNVLLVYYPHEDVERIEISVVDGGKYLFPIYSFEKNRKVGYIIYGYTPYVIIRTEYGEYVYDCSRSDELPDYLVLVRYSDGKTALLKNGTVLSRIENRTIWVVPAINTTVNGTEAVVGEPVAISLSGYENRIIIGNDTFLIYMKNELSLSEELVSIKTISDSNLKEIVSVETHNMNTKSGQVLLVNLLLTFLIGADIAFLVIITRRG